MLEVMSAVAVALALMLTMSWGISFTLSRRSSEPHVREKVLRPAIWIGAIIVVAVAIIATVLSR